MLTALLTAIAAAPVLLLLGQGPLRRHRFAAVEREFYADWSRLTPEQKAAALAGSGEGSPAASLDDRALALVQGAWKTMRAAGEIDFHRLRGYCQTLSKPRRP